MLLQSDPDDHSSIIYTAFTKDVDSISEYLSEHLKRRAVEKYHGKMGPRERKEAHIRHAFCNAVVPRGRLVCVAARPRSTTNVVL